jgi:hypothetical protein
VVRDTWVSNVGAEADAKLGGAGKLKLKSHQEMSLIDIDPESLRGRVVLGATLHIRRAADTVLRRVTVSSVGAPWEEGTSGTYAPQKGSCTFRHRRHPDDPWAGPGCDLCSVILGAGGTVWRTSDAEEPDAQRWQRVPVDSSVVAARIAGVSHGFLLFDDTGSEWTRDGEQFHRFHFPNRFVFSRESGPANAPFLTVFLGPEDHAAPAAPTEIMADAADLPAGEAWVSWRTPADEGPAGTVGFFVCTDGREVSRYLIPAAGKPGERVRMHLRDLGLASGAEVRLTIRAVDGAGNIGPEVTARVRVSAQVPAPLPGDPPAPFGGAGPLPRLAGAEVAVVDELDKLHPVSGLMIPRQAEGYLHANHLWSAAEKQIRLQAGRNEFVGFQICLRGPACGVRAELTFGKGGGDFQPTVARYQHIPTKQGPLPDPIVPLDGPLDVPVVGRQSESLYCEVYVPHDAPAGEHTGALTLRAGEESLSLKVTLKVWDFTLPDYLSFLPEMNCYGLPDNERDYYRLAHRHRTFLNRVPYSQRGVVHDGCAPGWDGKSLDWSAWDQRFGPYFDGTAFADLPRRGVPLEGFYLPMHENWPTPMEGNYDGDYWADRAFPPSYRAAFVEVARQFAEHCNSKGWHDTLFQGFLNNKVDYKEHGWSRGSSPWVLDEPSNFQDFWALRWFGAAFHEGVNLAPGKPKMVFRCDISRPQWQRTALDGLLDYNVVSGAMRPYHRLVFDRKEALGTLDVEYGTTNAITDANVQPVAWSLDAWALGCDGVLPWQTLGTANSWKQADDLALFYPPLRQGGEVIPSIRLKAYRRGQQDVEYQTLLSQQSHEPRWALGRRVQEALHLAGQRQGTGFEGSEDAGRMHYARLLPQELWALRVRVGEALSAAAPAPRRRLVDLRAPRRDPPHLPPETVGE